MVLDAPVIALRAGAHQWHRDMSFRLVEMVEADVLYG